jgi:PTH1 family peptidyl-tRNA hydrolase
MFLIVGLGNPGLQYQNNRHNVGYMVVDEMARRLGEAFTRVESRALVTKTDYLGRRLILAKPRTYMNLSGQSVAGLARFYKVPLERILIIYDDVDLPFEAIRMRAEGGSAGHNGMKSIIQHLASQQFPRLRIGVGRPTGRMATPDYVLQDFSRDQLDRLPAILEQAADAASLYITDGIVTAMNRFNQADS